MGYRSEVAIAMHKKDYMSMLSDAHEIAIQDKDYEYLPILLTDATKKNIQIKDNSTQQKKEYIVLFWSWIKWYDEGIDPVVTWIMENLPPIHKFIRIGEDYNDIEIITNEGDNEEEIDYDIYDIIQLRCNIELSDGELLKE